jgi:hypothetical protein
MDPVLLASISRGFFCALRYGFTAYFFCGAPISLKHETLCHVFIALWVALIGESFLGVTKSLTYSRTLVLSFTLALSKIKEAFIIQETSSPDGWTDDVIHDPCTDELLLSFYCIGWKEGKDGSPLLRALCVFFLLSFFAGRLYALQLQCSMLHQNMAVLFIFLYRCLPALHSFFPFIFIPFLV